MNDNPVIDRALYAAVRQGDIAAVPATGVPDVDRTVAEGGLHRRPLQGG